MPLPSGGEFSQHPLVGRDRLAVRAEFDADFMVLGDLPVPLDRAGLDLAELAGNRRDHARKIVGDSKITRRRKQPQDD